MASQEIGIKETLDLIQFLKDFALCFEASLADGKIDLFDSVNALKLAPELVEAIRGSDQIKSELLNLDPKEKDFILQELKDALFLLVRAVKK